MEKNIKINKRAGKRKKTVDLLLNWQEMFDSIPDFVLVLDRENVIVRANFRFTEAFNLSPEKLVGKKCYEVFNKSDRPHPNCPYEMSKKDKLSHSVDIIDLNTKIPLTITTVPILNDKNEVVGAIHIAKDISNLKKAEKETLSLSKFPSENPNPVLRIAKDGEVLYSNEAGLELLEHWNVKRGGKTPDKWRRIVEDALKSANPKLQEEEEIINAVDGHILLLSKDFRILNVNQNLLDVQGVSKADIIGKHCYEVTHNRTSVCEPPNDKCPILEMSETGKSHVERHTHYDATGHPRLVNVIVAPIRDEHGVVIKYLHFAMKGEDGDKLLDETRLKLEASANKIADTIMKRRIFSKTGLSNLIREGSVYEYRLTYLTKGGKKIPVSFSGSVMYENSEASLVKRQTLHEIRFTRYAFRGNSEESPTHRARQRVGRAVRRLA